jgi:hypothetical protein
VRAVVRPCRAGVLLAMRPQPADQAGTVSRRLKNMQSHVSNEVPDALSVSGHVRGRQVVLKRGEVLPFFNDAHGVFAQQRLCGDVRRRVNCRTVFDAAPLGPDGRDNRMEFLQKGISRSRVEFNDGNDVNQSVSPKGGLVLTCSPVRARFGRRVTYSAWSPTAASVLSGAVVRQPLPQVRGPRDVPFR